MIGYFMNANREPIRGDRRISINRLIKDHKDLGNFKGFKKIKAAEKPPGEWNHYEITVSGGNIELKVNGETVNLASGLDVLAGPIGLQSEGAEIHFRNIELMEPTL